MTRFILFTFILLVVNNLSGQNSNCEQDRESSSAPTSLTEQLDKMGIDDSPILNEYESDYLNFFYPDSISRFDFAGKKIGFMCNRLISNKQDYFKDVRLQLNNNAKVMSFLVLFDDSQKIESGGYDAFIVYWSKFDLSSADLLKIIKKESGTKTKK